MAGANDAAKRKRDDTGHREHRDRLTKLARMTVQDALKVTVGSADPENEKTFLVNKDMICAQSPYFKKACDAAQKVESELIFQLPDHKAAHFETYIDWVYTKPAQATPNFILRSSIGNPWGVGGLVKLWVLTNHMEDVEFKNLTMRLLVNMPLENKIWLARSPRMLQQIVANTETSSPLRLWLLDDVEARYSLEANTGLDQFVQHWPQVMVSELLKRFAARARAGATGGPPAPTDPTKYFEKA